MQVWIIEEQHDGEWKPVFGNYDDEAKAREALVEYEKDGGSSLLVTQRYRVSKYIRV
jgi:hypothetical protein